MIGEALKFFHKNPGTCLKDVRFVAFGQNRRIIDALRNEMNNVKQRNKKQPTSLNEIARGLRIEVINGDITREKTDAIVNMIGPDMDMNNAGELSKAILRSGGPQVQIECKKAGQQNAGSAVITTGGNLKAQYIIHLIPGSGSFKEKILICLQNCLYLADQFHCRSISLPAVGTGRYGLSAKESARIIFLALTNFVTPPAKVKHVRIVLPKVQMIQRFQQEKEKQSMVTLSTLTACTEKNSQVEIEIIKGNLTHENTDAIVNIINTDMIMSNAGQVSKAIAEAGGSQVEDECRRLGPQLGGTAVLTKAGDLHVRHIVHLIPLSSDKQHLKACLEAGLQLADTKGLQSISLPAIGTGGYGMSAVISANMIFQALGNFCKTCKHVRKVRIVILQDKMIEAFRQEKTRQETVHRDRVSTMPENQIVKVRVTGNDEKSVSKAVDTLKMNFSNECTTNEVKDESISKLSDNQVRLLLQEACTADVEMIVEAAMNRISVRGDEREVPKLVSKIFHEISESKKQEEKQQRHENALMVSKTIEWMYELDGGKDTFDLKTNYEMEMEHSKGHPSVKVSLGDDDFVIDLDKKIGSGQHSGRQITVIRRLKQTKGMKHSEGFISLTCYPFSSRFVEIASITD